MPKSDRLEMWLSRGAIKRSFDPNLDSTLTSKLLSRGPKTAFDGVVWIGVGAMVTPQPSHHVW